LLALALADEVGKLAELADVVVVAAPDFIAATSYEKVRTAASSEAVGAASADDVIAGGATKEFVIPCVTANLVSPEATSHRIRLR